MMQSSVLKEIKRKTIHMIPGFLAIPVVVWLGNPYATIISAFFLAIYTLHEASLRFGLNTKIPIASHTYKVMAREEELKGRYFTGTVYFWACTLAIVALMEPHLAAAAVMISSFGDAAAAITGKAIPKPKLPYNKAKTLAGSLAMFLTSTISCLAAGIQLPTALTASALSTLAESLTRKSVLDEATVPITAATTLWALTNIL